MSEPRLHTRVVGHTNSPYNKRSQYPFLQVNEREYLKRIEYWHLEHLYSEEPLTEKDFPERWQVQDTQIETTW